MQNQQQNQNQQQVKSISDVIKDNDMDVGDIRHKCICRIRKLLNKDELTEQDIQELNVLQGILKCCGVNEKWVNTKEEGEALKGLTMGTQNFEDWHIMRLLLKVKVIETLLNK